MEVLYIVVLSLSSYIVLLLLTKLMGDRQMSQLSMFDYIVGITIGSIAAEMATSLEDNFLQPLTAMIVYAILSVGLSLLSNKSLKLRKAIEGNPLILLDNGKLFKENFKKAKLDLNEFLMICRNLGYFDLNNIETAILEANGKISILPKTIQRPTTPSDLKLNPNQEKLVVNIILDGILIEENLKFTGNNEIWLKKELTSQHISNISDVFLATCDCNNKLTVYHRSDEVKKSPL